MKQKRFLFLIVAIGLGISLIFCSFFEPNKESQQVRIPVRFFPFVNRPIIKVEIEGRQFPVLIDLGSSHPLDLQKNILEKIKDKKELGFSEYLDIKGNHYSMLKFQIPLLNLTDRARIREMIVYEENEEFLTRGSVIWSPSGFWSKIWNRIIDKMISEEGRIGWTIFQNRSCFFDFPRSVLFVAKDIDSLTHERTCSLEKFVKSSFELERYGIILPVKTDLGIKKFLLDTGASRSILKRKGKQIFMSNKMEIGGRDFGKWEFFPFEISDEFGEIDGILGIDFFKKHAICLDFPNKMAYIQTAEDGPGKWEQFVCWFRSTFIKW